LPNCQHSVTRKRASASPRALTGFDDVSDHRPVGLRL
jgi:hypothetical protein